MFGKKYLTRQILRVNPSQQESTSRSSQQIIIIKTASFINFVETNSDITKYQLIEVEPATTTKKKVYSS
jgi:hypothetical protein